ncbi:hypothetical protein D187_008788 [Cystobacter fuscus DSM 2262]|uniref:HEAT repeat domain-containing protein n=1 Tax=Cystobacter fuscus (strain ATCC 25194 / DSM 2262 / NBRC 100088 / M29) TaxID=1242864 RepID=S9PE26_CYSF2|nr:HEAT repeat domain-containing protein [Cystobacter fuscus]EPX62600.1 hypothetical protein D187_008788 [Cystobacter fuscus DSM 2262]
MTASLLLLLLLSAGQPGSQGATGCWTACQRHVQDPGLRARVCRTCLTSGRAEGWLLELAEKSEPAAQAALRSALGDPNWRVRWGAVRAQAKQQGVLDRRMLADWVSDIPARDELVACVTAVRAAAATGASTASFLKDAGARGPAAAARVWEKRDAVRRALEVEVYAEDAALRGEALLHLATFLGRTPARVVLEALAQRPESADAAPASALLWVADKQNTSVGRLLLLEAKQPADQVLINRLFAVYSQELEALQKGLAAPDVASRRATVQSLRLYGPLARRELERALGDEDPGIRQIAARALAQSEGLSLTEAAGRWLRTADSEPATRRAWWEVAAADKRCDSFLLELARDTRLAPVTRGEAVARLSECEKLARRHFDEVSTFLTDAQPQVRAGAVRALAQPRSALGDGAVAAALEDAAPEVVVAALFVVGQHRQKERAEDVVALLDAASPEVRQAAIETLERLGRAQDVKPLALVLREDRVAAVRVAAARALGVLGGPFAASALSQALSKDPDSHVQHVARRGLERLGFNPP